MGRITIFSTASCPHCLRAKTALHQRNIPYQAISLATYPERRHDMLQLSDRVTVPQVFFNDRHVGGADELLQLLENDWDQAGDADQPREDWALEHYRTEVEAQPDPTDPRLRIPESKKTITMSSSFSSPDLRNLEIEANASRDLDSIELIRQKTPQDEVGTLSTDTETSSTCDPEFGCVILPDGTTSSVQELTSILLEIMPRKKLPYMAKYYNNCFVGNEGVDALLKRFPELQSRQCAVEFGRMLHHNFQILHHVCDDRDFMDTPSFYYRLQPYHDPAVLNTFVVCTRSQCQSQNSPEAAPEDHPMALLQHQQELLFQIRQRATDPVTGSMDYQAAKSDPLYSDFEEAACRLQCADLMKMDADTTRKAFCINVYNLMVQHAFLKVGVPVASSQRGAFFGGVCYQFQKLTPLLPVAPGNRKSPRLRNKSNERSRSRSADSDDDDAVDKRFNCVLSMDGIEHGILRANTRHPYHLSKPFSASDDPRRQLACSKLDPRIHFALNCGAKSCPAVSTYSAENLDEELQWAAMAFCEQDGNILLDESKGEVSLSMLFKWYRADFGASSASQLPHIVLPYLRGSKRDTLQRILDKPQNIKVKFLPYDWNAPNATNFAHFKSSVLNKHRKSVKAAFSRTPSFKGNKVSAPAVPRRTAKWKPTRAASCDFAHFSTHLKDELAAC